MTAPRHTQISCDESLHLLSRSLDGDLTRAETRHLYLHLASCESCCARMGEMALLAVQMAEVNQQYTSQSLDPTFFDKVQEAVRQVEQERPTPAFSAPPG